MVSDPCVDFLKWSSLQGAFRSQFKKHCQRLPHRLTKAATDDEKALMKNESECGMSGIRGGKKMVIYIRERLLSNKNEHDVARKALIGASYLSK